MHAHIGWMFDETATDFNIYAKDLLADPIIIFFHQTRWAWCLISLMLPFLYGLVLGGMEHAWGSLLIGGYLRIAVLNNVVWAVNSFGHSVGYQNFHHQNNSKNNFILALLTFGDGWHNNHHRFPRSAWHGLRRHELDVSGLIIDAMERRGIVKNVVRVHETKTIGA